MIRIDAIWLATEPMDMRAGTETALARCGRRVWCGEAALRLSVRQPPCQPDEGAVARWRGHLACRTAFEPRQIFHWPGTHRGLEVGLNAEQLQALVLGLPWQRVGANGAITMILALLFSCGRRIALVKSTA